MRATVIGVVLAMLMPAQSFALTSLCVETHSTGFNWTNNQWVETTYTLDQYVVQDVSDNDDLRGVICSAEDPVTSAYGSVSANRCFNASMVGEQATVAGTTSCRVYYESDGTTITTVSCSGGFIDYSFIPTGEFVLSRTYAVPEFNPGDRRDSLVLSVGKCSVIAP